MRTKIILMLILFLSIKNYGQCDKCGKSENAIIYDFSTGLFEKHDIKPKYGKPIVFKIKNINRIFYTPEIEGISGETIDEAIDTKAPAFSPNSNQNAPTIKTNDSIVIANTNKATKVNVDLKDVSNIQNELIKTELNNYFGNLDYTLFSAKSSNSPEIIYKNYKNKMSVLSKRQQIFVYVLNKINSNYNNYLDKISTPNLTLQAYQKLFNDSNNSNDKTIFEKSGILSTIDLKNKYITLNQYQEIKNEFLGFLSSDEVYDVMQALRNSGNTDAVKEIKTEINEWKNYITRTDADIVKMDLHKKLNYVEIMNRVLSNPSSYEFVSAPIQAYGDYLNFDIDIKEKIKTIDNRTIISSAKKFSHKEFVNGGMRLDFGIGVSLDFGKKNESYGITENSSGDKFLVLETKSDYAPKLVGLLHASRRSSGNLAVGVSLGTALDVANFNINSIYIGPSLLWGRTDKVVFTAGPSFQNIKQLNPEFSKYAKEKLPNNFNLDDSKYVNNYKVGFFFAITYNLTKKQRGKFLQVEN